MLKYMSLKGKILEICLMLASFSLALGIVSIFALRGVSQKYDQIATNSLSNTLNLGKMFGEFRGVRLNLIKLGVKGISAEQGEKAIANILNARKNYAEATV